MRDGVLAAVVFAVAAACDSSPQAVPSGSEGGPALSPEEFVVFSRERISIPRLGVPVAMPVTVGSSPSPATIASDNPGVVAITADGELVGVRNGRANVLNVTRPGDALLVVVEAATSLALEPPTLVLHPGETRAFRLVATEGLREVRASDAEWASDATTVARVIDGTVQAGRTTGSAWVVATYGDGSARALVVVRARRPQAAR